MGSRQILKIQGLINKPELNGKVVELNGKVFVYDKDVFRVKCQVLNNNLEGGGDNIAIKTEILVVISIPEGDKLKKFNQLIRASDFITTFVRNSGPNYGENLKNRAKLLKKAFEYTSQTANIYPASGSMWNCYSNIQFLQNVPANERIIISRRAVANDNPMM